MESLLQPKSNNQQEISRYLDKTKESQKKYHDHHANKGMKEIQSGTKVCMQPWTNSKVWKRATVVKHHHTPRSYVVQAEDGRKYCCNRWHLRVCPAPGHGSLNGELPLGVDKDVLQNKEPAKEAESDQPTTPIMLPDIPSQEQPMHQEPAVENIMEPYVTQSGRQVVAPNRLDL